MRGNAEARKTLSTLWNQVGYGTTEQKARALESLLGNAYVRKGNILGIKASDDGTKLEFIYNDENSESNRSIDLTRTYTPTEWAEIGAEIHGESDVKKAVAAGGGWKEGVTFTTVVDGDSLFKGIGSVRQGVQTQENEKVIIEEYGVALKNKVKIGEGESIVNALLAADLPAKLEEDGKILTEIGGKEVSVDPNTKSGIDAIMVNIRNKIGDDTGKMKNFASGSTAAGSGGMNKYDKKSKETFDQIYSRVKDRAKAKKIFEEQ
tara:strand:- start:416 stop:1204 length:789 start_codon:yes stop_codon:yes gene_type:complete